MFGKNVIVTADKVKRKKVASRVVKISSLILLLFLICLYGVLTIAYSQGSFTITLDSQETINSGIAIFDSLNNSQAKRKLEAIPIKFMDNISYKWLPDDIDGDYEGSHNGENYIAYTFFIENQGNETLNYWYEVIIDDVIKNVDEAVRFRIYLNGEYVTYAKKNSIADEAEPDTVRFKDTENSKGTIILEKRANFRPGDFDKMTIVVWLEGDDPDCTDPLIGGELKMHMKITEEHIEQR